MNSIIANSYCFWILKASPTEIDILATQEINVIPKRT